MSSLAARRQARLMRTCCMRMERVFAMSVAIKVTFALATPVHWGNL